MPAATKGSMSEVHANGGLPDDSEHAAPLSGLLGAAVDGALREPAVLDGTGALLPAWRHIARLIAPLCHQVRFAAWLLAP